MQQQRQQSQNMDISEVLTVLKGPSQAKCYFVVNKQHIKNYTFYTHPFTLQIRGNYFMWTSQQKNQLVGCFKFTQGLSFRRLTFLEKGVDQEGPILGLKIYRNQKLWLSFYKSKESTVQQFNYFIKILSKKYIKQIGFYGIYKIIQTIGQGGSSKFYRVSKVSDQSVYGMKVIKKNGYLNKYVCRVNFQNQFNVLTQLSHRNIVKYQTLFQSHSNIYIVTEVLQFTLSELLETKKFITYSLIRYIMRHIIKALQYLKQKNVMHRDIKLQNIMFRKQKQNVYIPVLIDFGLAAFSNQPILNKQCGTPGYVAPQILNIVKSGIKHYDEACDMFAVGVICYFMLFKKPLFEGKDHKIIHKLNMECQINFDAPPFDRVKNYKSCLDFLKRTLQKDPSKRMTPTQALAHQFLIYPAKENSELQQMDIFFN